MNDVVRSMLMTGLKQALRGSTMIATSASSDGSTYTSNSDSTDTTVMVELDTGSSEVSGTTHNTTRAI